MHRFAIICSTVVLLGSTAAAFAADDAKTAAGRSLLANRGLTQFDADGNGTLDASERAAAFTARHAARNAPSVATGTINPMRYGYLSPLGYPNSNAGGYPYATANGYSYPSPVVYQYANFGVYPYSLPGTVQTTVSDVNQWSPAPNVHVMFGGVNPGSGANASAYPNLSGAGGVLRIGPGTTYHSR